MNDMGWVDYIQAAAHATSCLPYFQRNPNRSNCRAPLSFLAMASCSNMKLRGGGVGERVGGGGAKGLRSQDQQKT